jgi:hypothetical protein
LRQLSGRAGTGFFSTAPICAAAKPHGHEWISLHDQWQLSHVARARRGLLGLVLVVAPVAI